MKQIASLLCMAGLIFWLVGAAPVKAYEPPLEPSASANGSSVTVSVWDPMRQIGKQISYNLGPGITVVNLKQDKGLMAWVVHSGSTYYVTCCTYDPNLGNFVTTSIGMGTFSNVDHFNVKDGAISWLANQYIHAVTYDPEVPLLHPEKSAWQTANYYSPNMVSILTADGIVAWVRTESAISYYADFCGYHPGFKVWIKGEQTVFDITFFAIIQATVYVGSDTFGLLSDGAWLPNAYTPSLAYFLAQPTTGKKPLWVWFTDLSIGPAYGDLWRWFFGDGTIDTYFNRHSSYHTYQESGVYTAMLNIYNGAPPPQATIKIYPTNLPFLPLLLLDNGEDLNGP